MGGPQPDTGASPGFDYLERFKQELRDIAEYSPYYLKRAKTPLKRAEVLLHYSRRLDYLTLLVNYARSYWNASKSMETK